MLADGSRPVMPECVSLAKPFAYYAIDTALNVALKERDFPAFTTHDPHRTAATLLHESGWSLDVVEKALNHNIGGTRGVYNCAEYEPQRREMLKFWADYIEQLLNFGRVVMDRFNQVA